MVSHRVLFQYPYYLLGIKIILKSRFKTECLLGSIFGGLWVGQPSVHRVLVSIVCPLCFRSYNRWVCFFCYPVSIFLDSGCLASIYPTQVHLLVEPSGCVSPLGEFELLWSQRGASVVLLWPWSIRFLLCIISRYLAACDILNSLSHVADVLHQLFVVRQVCSGRHKHTSGTEHRLVLRIWSFDRVLHRLG